MLLKLFSDIALRKAMGQRARAMLETHFTRDLALQRWRRVVELDATGAAERT
jgi:hypothetical protein